MSHSLDRVLSLALEPWALTRPMLAIVAQVLGRRIVRASEWDGSPAAAVVPFERREREPATRANGLAVIPIHGVIAPRMNALTDVSGGASFEQTEAALREAAAESSVGTIVLDIDSCGGTCAGASECAAVVREVREQKPVVACANFQMCQRRVLDWRAGDRGHRRAVRGGGVDRRVRDSRGSV